MESLVLLHAFDLLEKHRDRLGTQLSSSDPIPRMTQGYPSFLSPSHSRNTIFFLIVPGRWLPRQEARSMDTKGSSRPFKAVGRCIHSDAPKSFWRESPPQRKSHLPLLKKLEIATTTNSGPPAHPTIADIFKDAPLLTHVVLQGLPDWEFNWSSLTILGVGDQICVYSSLDVLQKTVNLVELTFSTVFLDRDAEDMGISDLIHFPRLERLHLGSSCFVKSGDSA